MEYIETTNPYTIKIASQVFGKFTNSETKSGAKELPGVRRITYDLNPLEEGRDSFYPALAKCTDILTEGFGKLKSMAVGPYREYLRMNEAESSRTDDEYAFELIILGVLWKNHVNAALASPVLMKLGLRYMYELRRRKPAVKKYIDPVRGFMSSLFLYHPGVKSNPLFQYSERKLSRLLLWMEASGEYKQESLRLRLWQQFFKRLPEPYMDELFNEIIFQVIKLERNAERYLNAYIGNLGSYLEQNKEEYFGREDVLFCSRGKNEYFMNMVGAEIINRGLRNSFSATEKKAVLAPACMRKFTDDRCKAKTMGLDLICTGCTSDCNVNRLMKQGKTSGFSVRLIPHSSDFTAWLEQWKDTKEVGVVGVACVLNLLTGGYEMQSLNIPAQCVFLDYAGCTNHWCKSHTATQMSMNQLEKIINA